MGVVVLGGERVEGEGESDSVWAKSRRRGWIRNWYVSDWGEGTEGLDWGSGRDMGGGKGGIKRRMMAGWRAEARSLPLGSVDRVCPAAIFFIFFYFRLIGFISLLLFVPRQMVVLSARTEGHTLSKRTRRRITITAFHPRTRPCDPLPPKRGPDLPSSVSLLLSHCSPPGPMYLPLSAVFPSVFHFPPDRLHTDLVLVSLPRQLLLVFAGHPVVACMMLTGVVNVRAWSPGTRLYAQYTIIKR